MTDAKPSGESPSARLPHIVLIMADQLRADAVGFMGNPLVHTPNLDRLASRGVIFDQMHVQASVCMPSRGAILTGRYPRTIGMGNGSPLLDPRQTTLPEILQRRGYRTGLFGKLHLTPQQYTLNELNTNHPQCGAERFLEAAGLPSMPAAAAKQAYGFQEAVGYEDALIGAYGDWLAQRDPTLASQLPRDGMQPWPAAPREYGPPLDDVGQTSVPPELHPSWFTAESAAAFFRRSAPERPTFMQVSFVDPHHPWDPPRTLAEHYPPGDMPLPRHRDTGEVDWPDRLVQRTADYSAVDDHATQTVIAYYYAMIEMLDLAVGRLVEAIEASGELDRTIFAFVADHGEYLGDYGLFRKGSYHYDCITRVPAFISYPAEVPGHRRNAGLTQTIDLAPTLLELAGHPVHPGMQGDSLANPLRRSEPVDRPWTYTELADLMWGPFIACWTLRTGSAKLHWFPTDRKGCLFDLQSDPGERVDRYADPACRGLREEMHELLLCAIQQQVDPLPHVLSQY